uniref:Uncharacterized protein n=1 Tax=Tanacetum cinerariifolium TaxID=118510 RepID=A0A699GE52_TANCI|nr:hypothetical protein [Tanacetum cinerariifolium]
MTTRWPAAAAAARTRRPQRAVPGVDEQVAQARAADDGRAVRRHGAQPGPEAGVRRGAGAGEQVVDDHLERVAPARIEALVEARDFGHAAHADAVVEPGHGNLVGFVEDGRDGRGRGVHDRHRDRIPLERIDGNVHQALQQRRGIRAQRHHVRIGRDQFAAALHASDLVAGGNQAVDGHVVAEFHAHLLRHGRQPRGEQLAVAGFVVGQAQAADQLVLVQARLGADQLLAVQQFIRNAGVPQNGDILGRIIELFLGTEELGRALLAAFVGDAGGGAQDLEAVAAVLGQAHHAFLVDGVALGCAVLQHLPHPLQLEQRAVGRDGQRRVALHHPLDGFQGDAGRGPGRRVAGRNLARVGKAGLERGTGLAVEHGYVVAGLRQVIGAGDTDDTTTEDDDAHVTPENLKLPDNSLWYAGRRPHLDEGPQRAGGPVDHARHRARQAHGARRRDHRLSRAHRSARAGRQAAGVCRDHAQPEIRSRVRAVPARGAAHPGGAGVPPGVGRLRLPDQGPHPRNGRVPQAAGRYAAQPARRGAVEKLCGDGGNQGDAGAGHGHCEPPRYAPRCAPRPHPRRAPVRRSELQLRLRARHRRHRRPGRQAHAGAVRGRDRPGRRRPVVRRVYRHCPQRHRGRHRRRLGLQRAGPQQRPHRTGRARQRAGHGHAAAGAARRGRARAGPAAGQGAVGAAGARRHQPPARARRARPAGQPGPAGPAPGARPLAVRHRGRLRPQRRPAGAGGTRPQFPGGRHRPRPAAHAGEHHHHCHHPGHRRVPGTGAPAGRGRQHRRHPGRHRQRHEKPGHAAPGAGRAAHRPRAPPADRGNRRRRARRRQRHRTGDCRPPPHRPVERRGGVGEHRPQPVRPGDGAPARTAGAAQGAGLAPAAGRPAPVPVRDAAGAGVRVRAPAPFGAGQDDAAPAGGHAPGQWRRQGCQCHAGRQRRGGGRHRHGRLPGGRGGGAARGGAGRAVRGRRGAAGGRLQMVHRRRQAQAQRNPRQARRLRSGTAQATGIGRAHV